jgi:hypothetical protein
MWTKHFRRVDRSSYGTAGAASAYNDSNDGGAAGTSAKFSSFLPEVYAGHPNRIQRYYQYAEMDRDSDIGAALDTIADFCTQSEEQAEEPFNIVFSDDANETEVTLINANLKLWVKMNKFRSRLWEIFRKTLMNGDQFFLRDPETGEWTWVDHFSVEMVKVDDQKGKTPSEYILRGLDLNRQAMFATKEADPTQYRTPFGTSITPGSRAAPPPSASGTGGGNVFQMAGNGRDPRQQGGQQVNELTVVDAKHIIHLSLSVGMDINWPFGQSILEPIFKTFKQKEMLEDSIIIYRVQRAPERRIFYVDVGSMSPARAQAHVERIKNEIHQRRIPNRTGGGSSIMDAAYNPMSIMEDYFFAQSADGKGSKVETLPGGDNLGEIGDLSYFTKKLARGLKIPTSYMSFGDDSHQATFNDGKLGQAVIEEFKFNKYCMRLQSLMAPVFDSDFKNFLKDSGIDQELFSIFELAFNPPQNFTKYRQIELDAAQVAVYTQVQGVKALAERYKFERYLNMSADDMLRNETLWKEENPSKVKKAQGATPAESDAGGDLASVGMRGDSGMGDFDFDDEGGDDLDAEGGPPADTGDGGAPPPPVEGAGGGPPL